MPELPIPSRKQDIHTKLRYAEARRGELLNHLFRGYSGATVGALETRKLESKVRYLGIGVVDALEMAEQNRGVKAAEHHRATGVRSFSRILDTKKLWEAWEKETTPSL